MKQKSHEHPSDLFAFVFIAYDGRTKLLSETGHIFATHSFAIFFLFSLFAINYQSVESFLGACKRARQVVDVRERC